MMPLAHGIPFRQKFLIDCCLFPPRFEVTSKVGDEPTNDRGQTGAQRRLPVSSGQHERQFLHQVLGGSSGKSRVFTKQYPVKGCLLLVLGCHRNHLLSLKVESYRQSNGESDEGQ